MGKFSLFDQLKLRIRDAVWSGVSYQVYLLSLLAALVAGIVYRAFFHPLARIPGPTLAAVTGNWRNYHYFRATWHDDILKLHERYGRVVRIAPNEVSVVDAQALKQLFGHGTSARKTAWYHVWRAPDAAPSLFAETDPQVHRELRKRVSSAYSMSAILRYEQYIQSCLDLGIWKFNTFAAKQEVVDMATLLTALAFDIVGEIAFGSKFGHLKTDTDVFNMRATVAQFFYLASNFGHLWNQLRTFNNSLVRNIFSLLDVEQPLDKLQNFAQDRIEARKQGKDGAEREDMLAHFVKMKSLNGLEAAENGEILMEVMSLIGAGADTTSVAMSACLYYIGTHSDVYKLLREEIDHFYASNKLTDPITYQQTQHLVYLKAVVSESLRLFPSIPYQLLRISPGIMIDKHYIPKGFDIGISPMAQNRDQAVFGQDADTFRPERWLQSDDIVAALERSNMTWGGTGPRMCIGRNIALVEINKLIAQFLYNFDFEIVDQKKPWHISTFWFAHVSELNVRLSLRTGRRLREPSN